LNQFIVESVKPMLFTRHASNPLITPAQVQPSRSDFEIIGTFNAGVTRYHDELLMLVRAAERPVNDDPNSVLCPHLDDGGNLVVERIRRDDPAFNTSDPRVVRNRTTGDTLLTSISHLRLAHSADGIHWTVESRPWMQAEPPYESFGVEDARKQRWSVRPILFTLNAVASFFRPRTAT
jgi:beta-1,2-mannobiose phosphorylase / 1,2-beta-oligomannan phosphorylase